MSEKTVFIVDDDRDFLLLASKALNSESTRVIGFESAGKVLQEMQGARPDLIIVDLKMRDLEGFEWDFAGLGVCQAIRQRFGEIAPILVLTANSNARIVVPAFKLGADDYFSKDLGLDALRERVEFWLSGAGQDSAAQDRRRITASQLEQTLMKGDDFAPSDWRSAIF